MPSKTGPKTKINNDLLKPLQEKYDNGRLTYDELFKFSRNERGQYLVKEINKKYNIKLKNIDCQCCASKILYDNSGSISNEDLLSYPNIKNKFMKYEGHWCDDTHSHNTSYKIFS
jgi:hypothetical protein